MITDEQTAMLTALAEGLSTPPRLPILRTPADYDMEFEEVSFTTADGVEVSAWFMPSTSNRVVISNHFSPGNKYGFAGHLEGLDFAGGFEVNFLPRYQALVEAGYNVLAYDLRSHGGSGDGEGAISGVGYYEWQEVLASLDYVRSREDTQGHEIFLMSMCMGANATFNAMDKHPEAFEGVSSMIAIAPLKGRTSIERSCERMAVPVDEGVEAFEPIYNDITGLTVDDHDIIPVAEAINVPTFFFQVRDDTNSRWTDVQEMYERAPVDDKKIDFLEGTPWRFQGYNYFSDHPEAMIEWFDAH